MPPEPAARSISKRLANKAPECNDDMYAPWPGLHWGIGAPACEIIPDSGDTGIGRNRGDRAWNEDLGELAPQCFMRKQRAMGRSSRFGGHSGVSAPRSLCPKK